MMRAKLRVNAVNKTSDTSVQVEMAPVCSKPFDADGNSEDNTYAKWTPSGQVKLSITNPNLTEKFRVGQMFYADFTEAAE